MAIPFNFFLTSQVTQQIKRLQRNKGNSNILFKPSLPLSLICVSVVNCLFYLQMILIINYYKSVSLAFPNAIVKQSILSLREYRYIRIVTDLTLTN